MKINFPLPTDEQYHQYCEKCHSENIHRIFEEEKTFYLCDHCAHKSPRLIVIDPQIVWWIDKKTKEYWHESVGIFIFNKDGKALFFQRIIYPFALTIPSGHLDIDEDPSTAAIRELEEEAGIKINAVNLFTEEDICGDKCRRGADIHKWHLYTARLDNVGDVKINDEGVQPVWFSLEEASQKDLTYPVRYFIEKYGPQLFKK